MTDKSCDIVRLIKCLRATAAVSLLLLLGSCATANLLKSETETLIDRSGLLTQIQVERRTAFTLPRGAGFYLARNPAIDELNISYGFAVTEALESEAGRIFPTTQAAMMPESLVMARHSASRTGLDFVLFPRLLQWDDDIGTWTELGRSLTQENASQTQSQLGLDEVELQLMMVHAATGRVVDIARVAANSGLLSLYGDNPDALLRKALNNYFSALAS